MNRIGFALQWLAGIVMAVVLSSCSGMLFTSIDILRPAKVTFPADATDIVLINNSVKQDPAYGHTTLLLNQQEKNEIVETDSLSVYCLAALTEGIIEKEFFGTVKLEPNSINSSNSFTLPAPPERETINQAATRNLANGIVSLNRILVNDQLGEIYDAEYNIYISYLEAFYETQWSVHFPLANKSYTFTAKDTVFWEAENYSRQKALQGLPDRRNALIDGALIVGEKTVNRLIPWWDRVDRYFFTTYHRLMKKGIEAVYRKDWAAAVKSWEEAYELKSSNTFKAKLSHNIAVVSEIQGDIEKAKRYSDLAFEYLSQSLFLQYDYNNMVTIANYNDELDRRLREISKVNLQLGEKP